MPPQPISPQPVTTNPQGVANISALAPPTPAPVPQAPQVGASPPPVATPNFNTSGALGDIANYYQIPRQTAAIAGAGQAQGQVAQQQFERQKAENNIKIQNTQNALDPSKYQFSKNADGSVAILNSVGDKVDIGTYASLTGANPAEALQKAGATDQASEKFITAYNNFQDFAQTQIAAKNGDEQATIKLGEYYKANPGLQNMELGQLQSAFMQQYGNYFGQPKGNQGALKSAGANPTLSSANGPIASSPYYQMQAYSQLQNPNPITQQLLGNAGGNSTSSALAQLQAQVGQ